MRDELAGNQTEMFITKFLSDEDVHRQFGKEVASRRANAGRRHVRPILSMKTIAADIREHSAIEDTLNRPPMSPFASSF